MKRVGLGLIFLVCSPWVLAPAGQAKTQIQASASFENRNFIPDRQFFSVNDQETLETTLQLIFDNEKFLRLHLEPRLKIDFLNTDRNRYLPRESYLRLYANTLGLKADLGLLQRQIGGFTVYNALDGLNRRDLEDNFFEPEKMGDPMLALMKTFSRWQLEFFFLPFFLETPLPQLDTRYPLQGQAGLIPYTLNSVQEHPSATKALGAGTHASTTLAKIDLGLFYYHGLDKTPGFQLIIDPNGALRLRPFYYTLDVIGLNLETSTGPLLWRAQGAYKYSGGNAAKNHEVAFEDGNAIPQSHTELALGLEYSLPLFSRGELRLVGEYYRELAPSSTLRNFRPFQNDAFLGLSYDFQNPRLTRLSSGVIKDMSDRESAILAELSSTIYRDLKLSLKGLAVIRELGKSSPISFFRNNSQGAAELSYAHQF